METQIYIPKKIKAGYQKRSDTYSKKLAYVVYYDDKGKLRKETSWKGWIDEEMGIDDFDNIPLEGFVLNRNVGGAKLSYGHDVRIEKVRVYDPRGFEIEIDVPNVLFILNECTSVKGKGLDGTFVYGWNGPNLTLIPTNCQEYKNAIGFTNIQANKISAKELIIGVSYKTKKMRDLVYLGRFDWYNEVYNDGKYIFKPEKKHIFVDLKPESLNFDEISLEDFDTEEQYNKHMAYLEERRLEDIADGNDIEFVPLTSLTSLAICNSDTPISNYAELLERFATSKFASTPIEFIEESVEPQPKMVNKHGWEENEDKENYFLKKTNGGYLSVEIESANRYEVNNKANGFQLDYGYEFSFDKNNSFVKKSEYYSSYSSERTKKYTLEEIKKLGLVKLKFKLNNNKIADAKQYL